MLPISSSALQVGFLHGDCAERSRPRGPIFRIRTAKLSWAFGPAARRGTGNFRGAHRKTGFGERLCLRFGPVFWKSSQKRSLWAEVFVLRTVLFLLLIVNF